ncbi:uncharacterized protein LOC100202580 isoform X1 [Hydra vulgaris]|uniref:uncharacterized protein LOC100202580 isoform X1 n=1 Tax=Hydra vulgaris TaxID=6087 RepID=UPI001F5E66B3|nr:uncharacterized protein LOC100202580 [Hydra vulgaris]
MTNIGSTYKMKMILLLFVCFVFAQAKDPHNLSLHKSGVPRSEDVFIADENNIYSDFISHSNQVLLKQGTILGKLDVLKKEYSVSFNIFPKSYTKGRKSVLHLTQDKDFGDYGDRIPGVWFDENGSGRLFIHAAVNGNINYYIETKPLPLNQWTNVKIGQSMRDNTYLLFVYLNGVKFYVAENTDARDFKNVKVYASDPWYDAQNGLISNILIVNGNVENIVSIIPSELEKGKLIAEIPKFNKEYLVSFDVYPSTFVAGQHSVIRFSIGSDLGHYDDRVPVIWFHANGKGSLCVSALVNGNFDKCFVTKPFELNQWSNVEVSQILRKSVYVYTIKINDDIVFSEINNQVQSFDNVKVYAADPWYDVQNGLIKNFFVVNGFTNDELERVIVLPKENIFHNKQLHLSDPFFFGSLYVLKKEFTVSFNVFYKVYIDAWTEVFSLRTNEISVGENIILIVRLLYSGDLSIATNLNSEKFESFSTPTLPLNQWSNVKICQTMRENKYWFSVFLNGVNVKDIENTFAIEFKNIMVYASYSLYWDKNVLISNVLTVNGNADIFVSSMPIELAKGKLIAEIPKLDKKFLVSFDIYPREFVVGWHSVIHFTIGSNLDHYGDRVPGIWFNADGKGGLHVSAPINGNLNRFFNTNPIELNQWSNIEVSQVFRNSEYVYTIRINKKSVFSEINNQVQSFDNVKVYAADPWHDVQNCLIKDFFVVNGITDVVLQSDIVPSRGVSKYFYFFI